jgi:hypothetical protein
MPSRSWVACVSGAIAHASTSRTWENSRPMLPRIRAMAARPGARRQSTKPPRSLSTPKPTSGTDLQRQAASSFPLGLLPNEGGSRWAYSGPPQRCSRRLHHSFKHRRDTEHAAPSTGCPGEAGVGRGESVELRQVLIKVEGLTKQPPHGIGSSCRPSRQNATTTQFDVSESVGMLTGGASRRASTSSCTRRGPSGSRPSA